MRLARSLASGASKVSAVPVQVIGQQLPQRRVVIDNQQFGVGFSMDAIVGRSAPGRKPGNHLKYTRCTTFAEFTWSFHARAAPAETGAAPDVNRFRLQPLVRFYKNRLQIWRRAFSTLHVYAVPAPWRGRLSCRADGGLRLPAGAGRRRSLEAPQPIRPTPAPRNMPPAASRCRPCSRCRCVRLRPSTIAPCRWTPRPATFGRPNPVRTAPCSRPWPGGRRRRDPRPGRLAVRRWQR